MNPITVTIVDAVNSATNLLNNLFYLIWTLIARITDWLQIGVEILAGTNKTAFGQDIVSVIIQNGAVQSVFWNLVSVCTALMVFFTIIKIIMDQYDSKAKGGNPYKQVFTMFKGMLIYFFITGFVLVAMYASGIIFNALKNATGGGSARVSAIIWQQMAYDANRLRGGYSGTGYIPGGNGEENNETGGYDTNDKYYYRLSSDYENAYSKGTAKSAGWDGNKLVLVSLSPDAGVGTGSIPYGDEIYGWGIENDDGTITALNAHPSAAPEEEVTWNEGTIYDESLWGNGFATSESDWGSINEYDPARGGWSTQDGGYASTKFNNPAMSVVKANIGVNVDARFQPVYYVEKTFPLKGPDPAMKGDVHVTVLGSGAVVPFNLTYYQYENPSKSGIGFGYTKVEGSGADKLSIDISGGVEFGAGGASASFGISTFNVGFDRIFTEMMMSIAMGLPVDLLMSSVSASGRAFPFGLGLFGVEILSGAPLVKMITQPLIDGVMGAVSESLSQVVTINKGTANETEHTSTYSVKSPIIITDDGTVTIKILRPMSFQEFLAFWLGEELAKGFFPGEVMETSKGTKMTYDKGDGTRVPVNPKKDPNTGEVIPQVYSNPGAVTEETFDYYDVNRNGKLDTGVLGQLTTINVGGGGDASVPWGTGKSIADAAREAEKARITPNPDGTPGPGAEVVNEAVASYEEQAKDVVAQIQEQSTWAAYNYLLSQYEKTPVGGTVAPNSYLDGSLIDNICRYLFNAAFIDEVEKNGGPYGDLGDISNTLDGQQTNLETAIRTATGSTSYRKVVSGDRPSVKALPGILSGTNTIYTPISVNKSGGGFMLDLHPVKGEDEQIYLVRAIDWDAYGHISTDSDETKDFADTNNLQMGAVDFNKYVTQYIKELSAATGTEDEAERNQLAVMAGNITQRLHDEYATPTGNGRVAAIEFAEQDGYYGVVKKTGGASLEELLKERDGLKTQSTVEETSVTAPVAEVAAQAETTYDNSTITFVNLQDVADQRTALADSVKFTRAVDFNKAKLKVNSYAPIYSFGVGANGAFGASTKTPSVNATAAAIDKLYLQDYAAGANTAYVLALAGVKDGGAELRAQLSNTEDPGYYLIDSNGGRFPLTTEVIGVPHYMNMGTLIHCYNMGDMDFIMGFIAIFVTLGVYMNFSFGLIQRLLNLAVLYLISPLSIAFYPFDEGAKFKSSFFQPFYKEVTASYAIILSLNLFFVVFPVVRDAVTEMFTTKVVDENGNVVSSSVSVLGMFFTVIATISLVSMLPKIREKLQEVLGAGGMESKSLGAVVKDAKSTLDQGGFGMAVKGLKKAGGVGATLGRRMAVNMANPAKVAAKREAFLAKRTEQYAIKAAGGQENWKNMTDDDKKALRDDVAGQAQKSYDRAQTRKKVVGGIAATVATGGIYAGVKGVKAVGGVVMKATGATIGKTAFGQSVKDMVLAGDGKVSKFVNAHTAEGMAAERKKYEDKRTSYEIAKQDVTGTGNKQIGMAIERTQRANEAQLELNKLSSKDPKRAELQKYVDGLRSEASQALTHAQREEGFKGSMADVGRIAAMEPDKAQAAVSKMVDANAASKARVMNQITQSGLSGSVAQERERAINSEMGRLPDSVKVQIAQTMEKNKNESPKDIIEAIRAIGGGAERIAMSMSANLGTGGAASNIAFDQMVTGMTKTLGDSIDKMRNGLETSLDKANTSIESGMNSLKRMADSGAFGEGRGTDARNIAKDIVDAVKNGASSDKLGELYGKLSKELTTGLKQYSDYDKNAMLTTVNSLIGSVEQKSRDNLELIKTANAAQNMKNIATSKAGSSFNKPAGGPTGPTGGAGA